MLSTNISTSANASSSQALRLCRNDTACASVQTPFASIMSKIEELKKTITTLTGVGLR